VPPGTREAARAVRDSPVVKLTTRRRVRRRITKVADSGASGDSARGRRYVATDPALDDVLRAAGFEVTEAGRQRWRRLLAQPIPQAAVDEARRLLDRARGRAA
jgi:hypothetical protein